MLTLGSSTRLWAAEEVERILYRDFELDNIWWISRACEYGTETIHADRSYQPAKKE